MLITEKRLTNAGLVSLCFGCGGRTRTYDLRVMSPTSYHLLHSAIFKHPKSECLIIISQSDVFVNCFFEKQAEKVTVFIAVFVGFLGDFAKFSLWSPMSQFYARRRRNRR